VISDLLASTFHELEILSKYNEFDTKTNGNNTIVAKRVSAEQYAVIEALMGSHAVQYRSDCPISVSRTQSNNS